MQDKERGRTSGSDITGAVVGLEGGLLGRESCRVMRGVSKPGPFVLLFMLPCRGDRVC